MGISVKSLDDIFAEGQALLAIIGRYRPDLVELNQCALEILKEEYGINMPLVSYKILKKHSSPILIVFST